MHKCVDVENGLNGLYVGIYAPFHREVEVVKILSMCKHKNEGLLLYLERRKKVFRDISI